MKAPTEMHDLISPPTENLSRSLEESELLTQVGRGSRACFEELHRRLFTLLFSTTLGILNNREAAEDVTQDVFLQIWEKAPTYDPARGKAATWVLTLARNKAIDRLRSIQRRARLREEAGQERALEQNFDDRNSLHDAVAQERIGALRSTLEKLNLEQREAIRLAYFEDMPYPEVARTLRTPLGTVKARIRRGMQRLRELLEPRL